MILVKKALRAIWENKKAYIACIVLIALGILIYGAMGIAVRALDVTRDTYFKQYRMADVFGTVKAIPKSVVNGYAQDMRRYEGLADVNGRFIYEARVIMPNNEKIITMRMISVDRSLDNRINNFLIDGNDFQNENDIMVGETFLTAHHLKLGDSVKLIIDGKERDFNICATVQSPEYVYVVKDMSEMLPDPETFCMAFIPEEQLFSLTNNSGMYNDISFMLESGYKFDDVKSMLEDMLNKYGLEMLIPQKDQVSYAMLDTEIKSNTSMSQSIPFVFVLLSIIILYLMLKRVIEQDRSQIGTMKAFGYSNTKILAHYMLYGAITGVIGGVLGCLGGYFLSGSFLVMYREFYHMPNLVRAGVFEHMTNGMIMGMVGGLFGSFMGARSIIKLNPADAMRPAAPKASKAESGRPNFFVNLLLSSGGKMAIRSITRAKLRSFVVVLGVMFSFGILAFMGSYGSMIDEMLFVQFSEIQVYDGKLTFKQPVSKNAAVESMASVDGVTEAEALLEIPVEIKNGHLSQGVVINGIQKNSNLFKVYDSDLKIDLKLADNGVVISNALAKKLNAKKGDTLYLSSNLLTDDIKIVVANVVVQSMGQTAYMDIDDLALMMNVNQTATSVIFNTSDMNYAKEFMKQAKNVKNIQDAQSILKMYKDFMASYDFMMNAMGAIAVVVAFAIIYNSSTISLSERKREYATLRVVGMQVKEVTEILSFEYWILAAIGMVLGIPFTGLLKEGIASSIDIDMFTFPTYTPVGAYVYAAAGCIIAVILSNMSASKNIKKFDMVEVLKERE